MSTSEVETEGIRETKKEKPLSRLVAQVAKAAVMETNGPVAAADVNVALIGRVGSEVNSKGPEVDFIDDLVKRAEVEDPMLYEKLTKPGEGEGEVEFKVQRFKLKRKGLTPLYLIHSALRENGNGKWSDAVRQMQEWGVDQELVKKIEGELQEILDQGVEMRGGARVKMTRAEVLAKHGISSELFAVIRHAETVGEGCDFYEMEARNKGEGISRTAEEWKEEGIKMMAEEMGKFLGMDEEERGNLREAVKGNGVSSLDELVKKIGLSDVKRAKIDRVRGLQAAPKHPQEMMDRVRVRMAKDQVRDERAADETVQKEKQERDEGVGELARVVNFRPVKEGDRVFAAYITMAAGGVFLRGEKIDRDRWMELMTEIQKEAENQMSQEGGSELDDDKKAKMQMVASLRAVEEVIKERGEIRPVQRFNIWLLENLIAPREGHRTTRTLDDGEVISGPMDAEYGQMVDEVEKEHVKLINEEFKGENIKWESLEPKLVELARKMRVKNPEEEVERLKKLIR